MTLHGTTVPTPIGPFTLLADGDAVRAAGFAATPEDLARRLGPAGRAGPVRALPDLGGASKAVLAYFEGDLDALGAVPVAQPGTPFLQAAWEALRGVPAGSTVTYRRLAELAGAPGAARAAGSACARNRIALIVPCHRVVPSAGGPGGYYWGTERKRWLLAHEARRP